MAFASSLDPAMNGADFVDANPMESPNMDPPSQDLYGDNTAEVPPLDRLKSRGKGIYSCTQGMDCKKGGVENGKVKVFSRNSDFRYVAFFVCPGSIA
jgi:hypothetical protein